MNASFNQLHNWRQTSQYWQMINSLPDNKKNLHIRYKYKDTTRTNPYVNIIWHYISKEFHSKFGNEFSFYGHFDLFTGDPVDNCNPYPTVYIHTAIYDCLTPRVSFDVYNFGLDFTRFTFTPKDNKRITKEYIKQQVFEYIEKHLLYAPGYFRDLQELNSWNKDQVKHNYKYYLNHKENIDPYDYELKKYFTRKYNIVPGDSVIIDWHQFAVFCAEYVSKNGKPKELQTVCRLDFSGILDDFDGDVLEVESLLYERIEDYGKNVILI